MIRKRLPYNGARLRMTARTEGAPLCVHFIYGYKWQDETRCRGVSSFVPGVHPVLAVRPSDYAPGVYDFSVVTGLQVCVFDQMGQAAYYEARDFGPVRPSFAWFYELLGELGGFAAEVEVYSPALAEPVSAHVLALQHRHGAWPCWWPAELEEINAKRRTIWAAVFDEQRRELEPA